MTDKLTESECVELQSFAARSADENDPSWMTPSVGTLQRLGMLLRRLLAERGRAEISNEQLETKTYEAMLEGIGFALRIVRDLLDGRDTGGLAPAVDPLFQDVRRRIKALHETRK
jgi:hypothetical protein